MNIFEKLEPLTRQIQRELKDSVKDDFPHTLREPIRYFLETPGKRIRPLLTLLSCRAVGGNYEDALPAAVGIELFHDFTLIHDDIMDQDELRRGRSTIHKRWNESTAILVGDALVGMAYASMLRSRSENLELVLNHFSEGLIKVCEGQALDTEFESREQVNLDEYLDMIAKKTAWLFKLACQIGAIVGGGTSMQVEAMRVFGDNTGMGFQIQDDLLDFIADEKKLGKKVGSDLKMKKKTYVALKYNEHLKENSNFQTCYPMKMWEFQSLDQLQNTLFDLGIVEQIKMVVESYFNRAFESLQKVFPLNKENELYQIVRFLQNRQY